MEEHDSEVIERQVLGAILINNGALAKVEKVGLECSHFNRTRNAAIYQVMREMRLENLSGEIDLLTLRDALRAHDELAHVGGATYISSLVDGIPDVANVENNARAIIAFANESKADKED